MGQTLEEVAQALKASNKKVQLIYAFNGSGKTRLSREFKGLIAPKNDEELIELPRNKILYYNAFTEDLFHWDNDLENDMEPKLKIKPNTFTDWMIKLLKDLGEYDNIITNFQHYANDKITPSFNEEYKYKGEDYSGREVEITVPAFSEVTFKVAAEPPEEPIITNAATDDNNTVVEGNYERIKVSKGEESNFVWSIIFTLLEQVISNLNESDTTNRTTNEFDQLEYVFIDDPVSSLDENHLIELAVNLALLIKESSFIEGNGLRFIVTTHNPLFYNVLYNELNNDLYKKQPDGSDKRIYKRGQSEKYRLDKKADGTFQLEKSNDHPFSYHLLLLSELKEAINTGPIKKYHFNFLRNLLEKTATFLGYKKWSDLLPENAEGKPDPFANRILNLSSHSAHAGEEVAHPKAEDKEKLKELVEYIISKYGFG